MRKALLLSVLALGMSVGLMGQAQLDLQSRAALREMRSKHIADSEQRLSESTLKSPSKSPLKGDLLFVESIFVLSASDSAHCPL